LIVADTNLITYLLLPGEHTPTAEQVLEQDPRWIAPLLWRSEFRNVLALHIRQQLLSLDQARGFAERAESLLAGNEYTLASDIVLDLAAASGCSAYDCEFVGLALQRAVPLVTADRKILSAFPKVAIEPRQLLQSAQP